MSELRNAAARGESMLQKSMKAEFIKTQQRARSDGNSQQKSVTAFAEDEVPEKARTSAAAAGQTARHVGRTSVQHSPQSADELKRQAQIAKARIDKAKTAAAKKKAHEETKKNAAASKQPPSHSAGAVTEAGGSPSSPTVNRSLSALQRQDSAKQAYRQKNTAKIGAASRQPVKGASSVKTAGNAMGKTARRTFSYTGNSARTATHAATGTANAAKAVYKRRQQAKMAAEASRKTIRATVEAVKVTVKSTKALVTLLLAGGWVSVIIILIVVIFGCAISMFGGGSNSKSYTPVSVEVKDYRPIIVKYAKEHGIPEYVDLIMAVMMQESGGQGLDPMQASECSYNTRYLHHVGSIVDPEVTIQ